MMTAETRTRLAALVVVVFLTTATVFAGWNWLMVDLFGLGEITVLESFGAVLIGSILTLYIAALAKVA